MQAIGLGQLFYQNLIVLSKEQDIKRLLSK
jgi:hypothetical protein